jgi:hypothetical protein
MHAVKLKLEIEKAFKITELKKVFRLWKLKQKMPSGVLFYIVKFCVKI